MTEKKSVPGAAGINVVSGIHSSAQQHDEIKCTSIEYVLLMLHTRHTYEYDMRTGHDYEYYRWGLKILVAATSYELC